MIEIAKIFVYFLKEFTFKKKEEYTFKSSGFNSYKVMNVIIIAISVLINLFLLSRSIELARDVIDREEQIIYLVTTNVELADEVHLLQTKDELYNKYRLCLDSNQKLRDIVKTK